MPCWNWERWSPPTLREFLLISAACRCLGLAALFREFASLAVPDDRTAPRRALGSATPCVPCRRLAVAESRCVPSIARLNRPLSSSEPIPNRLHFPPFRLCARPWITEPAEEGLYILVWSILYPFAFSPKCALLVLGSPNHDRRTGDVFRSPQIPSAASTSRPNPAPGPGL